MRKGQELEAKPPGVLETGWPSSQHGQFVLGLHVWAQSLYFHDESSFATTLTT